MGDATPAADVGAMLLMEMALHGWDVARATGQEFSADDKTAKALEDIVQAQAELFRKYQGFADAIEPPTERDGLRTRPDPVRPRPELEAAERHNDAVSTRTGAPLANATMSSAASP